jgi:ABC-2 type transport system ATP-binding protein
MSAGVTQPAAEPGAEGVVTAATVVPVPAQEPAVTNGRPPVISTHGLSKDYKTVKALAGLELAVPANSIFGFLGPNGSGKTTTIKLLLGLIRPTQGSGTVFGRDIINDSLEIRKRTGYLAQEPRYYENLTARETLSYTAHFFYSGPARLLEARINEMLDLTGLLDKADRPIKGFSGGERQRLGIAQAQVNYPDLLILDEPAASLDPQGRHDVLAVMDRLRKYTTIFYSTHILDDVQKVSDRVAILNKGQLIAEAPIEQLLTGGSTIYKITMRGDAESAKQRVMAEPWVGNIDSSAAGDGLTTWQLTVTDAQMAEARLLRLVLADEGIVVTGFGRKTYELEEIFLGLVEGSNRDGR